MTSPCSSPPIVSGRTPRTARGADRLPPEVTEPVRDTLVRGLEAAEVRRALVAATGCVLAELRIAAPDAVAVLEERLSGLTGG